MWAHACDLLDQAVDKILRPGDQLHAQPHDQQHDRSIPLAGVFDLEVDAVGLNLHAGVDQTASRLNTSRSGSDTAGAKA